MIKAACHVHSEWSYDGKWSLQELTQGFGNRGYRVLMMTEHDLGFSEVRHLAYREACSRVSSEGLLVVPGIEYSDASNAIHVLVWGPVPFLGERIPTSELLEMVKVSNGVAVLAHPSRKQAWKMFNVAWAEQLLGIEAWNRKTDGWAPSPNGLNLVDQTNCLPFMGVDFHDQKQFFPLAMQLDLAGEPTEELVLECLRSRRVYPTAFGHPLSTLKRRWPAFALRSSERCRRGLAFLYRRAKDGGHGRTASVPERSPITHPTPRH
jgi:hypothetical protein